MLFVVFGVVVGGVVVVVVGGGVVVVVVVVGVVLCAHFQPTFSHLPIFTHIHPYSPIFTQALFCARWYKC